MPRSIDIRLKLRFCSHSEVSSQNLIKQGKTEKEIYDFLSEKYGDWILYKPKLNLGNFLLWFLPYLILLLGGLIILYIIGKKVKKT